MNSITCRYCQSNNVISYGHIHNGKKRYMCHDCHRQFTPDAQKKYISDKQREIVDKMLLERNPGYIDIYKACGGIYSRNSGR